MKRRSRALVVVIAGGIGFLSTHRDLSAQG
jgi:hypothetical protein